MTRIAWTNDIHLNFLDDGRVIRFFKSIESQDFDFLLIAGDIAQANNLKKYLHFLNGLISRPVFFVLGNHDFYYSSITKMSREIEKWVLDFENLFYLGMGFDFNLSDKNSPVAEVFRPPTQYLSEKKSEREMIPDQLKSLRPHVYKLSEKTGLVGHGCWADGRVGNYFDSDIMLNDYMLIGEYVGLNKNKRFKLMNRLGDMSADYFRKYLPLALSKFDEVIVLLHVPPFKEATWHEGEVSENGHLPHFSCKAVGEALVEIMEKHPDKKITVLCGHTHGEGKCRVGDNIFVITGPATYGEPKITGFLEV
ncbi:MAG: metallophosphoesterase [Candidatus Eremiobacteraeota bacterium]|nr:metallophosphoesterase [Candidatus Eremiobacteraeota bacterium]